MKIIYLINNSSKTSVPISWANYIKNNFKKISIELCSIKQFKMKNLQSIFRADIVHGHHIKAMYLFIMFNFIFNKKTVYTVHGSYLYLSDQNKKLLKYIFDKSDKIVFVNQYLYDVLPDTMKKLIKNKYQVVLNGVDTAFKYDKIDIYEKYNLKVSNTIIFHPARFVKEKNHLSVIEAFKKVSLENRDVKLVLAGDGLLRKSIEEKIEQLELSEKVVLLGLIDKNDVYNFLENCEVFIMPSISEGLNIAFLEAMTMKTKILVSDIEQFTYPFKHYGLNPQEYNTYFTNPNDIESIYKSFKMVLEADKYDNFDMNIFSLDSMLKKYQSIYLELIK